jgi:hypothetical protein
MSVTSPVSRAVLLLSLALGGALAACSSAPAPAPSASAEPVPSTPAGEAPVTGSPGSNDCAEAAATEPVGQCQPSGPPVEPIPTVFDCAAPAPLVPCCKALLPGCIACAERNRETEARWLAACKPSEPPPSADGTVTPTP